AEKELKQVEPWGAFDRERIVGLENDDVYLHFFTAPEYNEVWEKDKQTFLISELSSKVYFVVINDSQKAPELEADNVVLPKKSAADLKSKVASLEKKIEDATDTLTQLSASVPALEKASKNLSDNIQLTKVKLYTENIADEKAMLIEGYAPVEKEEELTSMLKSEGIYYTSEKADVNDNVPILLKNNRFNRLFEVISDLYAKPNYNEFDLTPFFGIFYMIFFGFCLGDAGYGLVFMLALTHFKRSASKDTKRFFSLGQLLSLSTIIFGLAGGTFFGLELYNTQLPVYRNLAASMSTMEGDFVSNPLQDIMLKASLGLGVVQILFGISIHGVLLTKQKGIMWGLSKFAWVGLFISSLINAAVNTGDDAVFLNLPYSIIAGSCVFVIFFLNTPNKNPLVNFGAGLWDAYNTLVGGLGDLLSYLRLFALGLASSILGLVFNQLSTTVLSDENVVWKIVTIIMMLLILTVGHGINIFMSTLSATVHPLRLVFVEFYKNAGFAGGGKAFQPFKKSA
ncbi:MAG: V-type ATP synthase subunit I, partial [Bacteroidales bacterium]|nr:V-type ATP synthase subunit I [Bacteroidales bacterium]